MILKPFMLRRIKKDVENELSDKVEEHMVVCLIAEKQASDPELHSSLVQNLKQAQKQFFSVFKCNFQD